MPQNHKADAFSLISLLVMVAIIGVVASITIPNLTKSIPNEPKSPVERAQQVDQGVVLSAISAAKQRVLISEDASVFSDDNEANFNVIKGYVTFGGKSLRNLDEVSKSMGPGVTLIIGNATTEPTIITHSEK